MICIAKSIVEGHVCQWRNRDKRKQNKPEYFVESFEFDKYIKAQGKENNVASDWTSVPDEQVCVCYQLKRDITNDKFKTPVKSARSTRKEKRSEKKKTGKTATANFSSLKKSEMYKRIAQVEDILKEIAIPKENENTNDDYEIALLLKKVQLKMERRTSASLNTILREQLDVDYGKQLEEHLAEEDSALLKFTPLNAANLSSTMQGFLSKRDEQQQKSIQKKYKVPAHDQIKSRNTARKLLNELDLGLNMNDWIALPGVTSTGVKHRHRHANVMKVLQQMFENKSFTDALLDKYGSVESIPSELFLRRTTDGAKFSKHHSCMTTSFTCTLFESNSHSPKCNFSVSHSYATESRSNIRLYLKSLYESFEKLRNTETHLVINGCRKKFKIQVVDVHDMKFLYNALGNTQWNCLRFFSPFCTCIRGGEHSHCTLRTNADREKYRQRAIKKYAEVDDGIISEDDFAVWVSEKNYGVQHDGGLAEHMILEWVYIDTFHAKENLTSSFIKKFWKHLLGVDDERGDVNSDKSTAWMKFLQEELKIPDYQCEELEKSGNFALIGSDCDNFRKACFFEKKDREHSRTVGDMLINGEYEQFLLYVSKTSLGKCLLRLKMFCKNNKTKYVWKYLVSLYSFFAEYEALTRLDTNQYELDRIKKLASVFAKWSASSVFGGCSPNQTETIYGHAFAHLMPLLAQRWYAQSGLGYGYMSMQGGEHMNKVSKSLFMNRTNKHWNEENYDAYASILHFDKIRYMETELVPTKQQKKGEAFKEEIGVFIKTLFMKDN